MENFGVILKQITITPAWIAAIGTVVMAIVSFLTLWRIKQQQEASYAPRLLPVNETLELKINSQGIPFFHLRGEKVSDDFSYAMHSVHLCLQNIGIGAAHSIRVKWLIPAQDLKRELIEISDKNVSFKDQGEGLVQYVYGNGANDYFGFRMMGDVNEVQTFSSIVANESVYLNIPESILNYFAFRAIVILKESSRTEIDGPPITLNLEYMDIGEKKVAHRVVMKSSLYASVRQSNAKPMGFLSLDFAVDGGGK